MESGGMNEPSTKDISDEVQVEEVKKTDVAFLLSWERCREVLFSIFLRKTPSSETLMQWDDDSISFYRGMCSCYGVDHDNLESSLKEDEEEDKILEYIPKKRPSPKEISHEEYEKLIKSRKCCCDAKILIPPFEFGAYFSGKPKSIPHPLYLLIKEAVDTKENTKDLAYLTIVEEKIRFFCKYFHAHLPTGWNYDRDNASTLLKEYYPHTVKSGDFMPIRIYEAIHYDEESGLSPLAMVLVMGIIYSGKMPSFSKMTPEMIAFYCKLCSCFGIDYQRVDATASWDDMYLMKTAEKPPSFVFELFITKDTRNKKKIPPKLSRKKIRNDKRSASSTSFKGSGRSQDEERMESSGVNEPSTKVMSDKELNEDQLAEVKKPRRNDDVFNLSWRRCREIIDIVCSRKTPTDETYMAWDEYSQSFYRKMCTCFRVDYKNLEKTLEDDGNKLLKKRKPSLTERVENKRFCCRKILIPPFEFGAYFSGKPKSIPRPLYMLVKKAVDIMNNTDDDQKTGLTIVEEKIKFFCRYFHAHLPTGWKYDRDKANTLVDDYDPKVKPRDFVAGYTPISIYETMYYDKESSLSPLEMAYVMAIIYSRKMPSIWGCCPQLMTFYCRLCSCFGIDYYCLEKASEDDVCFMKTLEMPPLEFFKPF